MRRIFWLLFAILACLPARVLAEEPPSQWILVTAPAFREALEPLCEHRRTQKMHVSVVQTTDVLGKKEILAGDADKLRERLNKLCRDARGSSYVLLVGQVEPDKSD